MAHRPTRLALGPISFNGGGDTPRPAVVGLVLWVAL